MSRTAFRDRSIAVGGAQIHVVQAGDPTADAVLFLHGWPETSLAWEPVMCLAARQAHAIAIDLPGVGRSTSPTMDGTKRQLAKFVHTLVTEMELEGVTLVGQDIGGMIVYSYLHEYHDLARAVIMDVVIPGIDPWNAVLHNPYLWHFAMHSIPDLPETLVRGREREYFDYFYDVLSVHPAAITAEARAEYAKAYADERALTIGFDWYRAFRSDAEENERTAGSSVSTPVLYVRGEREGGDIGAYVDGLQAAGLANLQQALVANAGHFTQEEAPEETWRAISEFAGLERTH